jgi:NAD(P)-dependent dehydrogenase (short-subunit alcohol dehydrogenase family)
MNESRDVVIVTGANGEIGFSVCEEFANLGYSVIAVTRRVESTMFYPIRSEIPIKNIVVPDLSSSERIVELLSMAEIQNANSINLVYGAAVFERVSDFRNVSPDVWDRALNVNLKNAFLWNQFVADFAIETGKKSSIVNVTSQAWMTGGYGEVIAYASSKGGLVSMTKSLARVVAQKNVRVNCVAPGFIDTKSMRGDLDETRMQEFLNRVPMGRLGDVAEVAQAIEFLISSKSSYVTGVTLAITGGQLMH